VRWITAAGVVGSAVATFAVSSSSPSSDSESFSSFADSKSGVGGPADIEVVALWTVSSPSEVERGSMPYCVSAVMVFSDLSRL
jgi:hypothetical protein